MRNRFCSLSTAALFLALPCTVTAGSIHVSLDTSPVIGHPAGPFYAVFALVDASGFGDGNNSVTVSNPTFGGGAGFGSPILAGGASGSFESGLIISDTSFFNLFEEQFIAGSNLGFDLTLTANDDTGAGQDRLTFYVLDSTGTPIPTLAPAGDYFLGADLGSTGSVFDVWASDVSRAPYTGPAVSIAAPSLSSSPEPATGISAGLTVAFGGMLLLLRKRICLTAGEHDPVLRARHRATDLAVK